jgi:hypothetical protein
MKDESSLPIRLLKGFGQFWWDFLIGDTPELFVAALVIIGAIALLSRAGHYNAAAVVTLPLLVVIALAISVRRASHASHRK